MSAAGATSPGAAPGRPRTNKWLVTLKVHSNPNTSIKFLGEWGGI